MINKILYNTIAIGGTFDHFHAGHKDFLLFAKEISKNMVIGITDQNMSLSKPFPELIQPLYQRKQAVSLFCNQSNINAKIITLFDPFGPTIEDNNIEAIACTTQTVGGANKINEIRSKLRLKELPVHIQQLKKDKLNLGVISAERIRAGEINRDGEVYESVLKNDIKLSEKMRSFFAQLHGDIIQQPSESEIKNPIRVVIGDTTLETFITNNWHYDLGIFDGLRQREKVKSNILDSLKNIEHSQNKPGGIEVAAVETLKKWLENKNKNTNNNDRNNFQHLFIDGEEDLVAVIAILLLPLNSFVYYGQPDKGMVECLVTEKLKNSFFEILK